MKLSIMIEAITAKNRRGRNQMRTRTRNNQILDLFKRSGMCENLKFPYDKENICELSSDKYFY